MFYMRVFRTKLCRQILQSCILGLKFFGAKILYKNCICITLVKLTAGYTVLLDFTNWIKTDRETSQRSKHINSVEDVLRRYHKRHKLSH
jgi:hypothetical protein